MNKCKTILICGVDEAGRGALCGDVYASAVILNPQQKIQGLKDSKKLSPQARLNLSAEIKEKSLSWQIASSSAQEIDDLNILQASLLAMKRAIESLPIPAEMAIIDGIHCPRVKIPTEAFIKGDNLYPSISAASILAKTARDQSMIALAKQYALHELDQHKGYPTKRHLELLKTHGIIKEIYRTSYAPVKQLCLRNLIA